MLHVADAAKEYTSALIRTVDSDVVVLAIIAFSKIVGQIDKLWLAYATGKGYRLKPLQEIYRVIGHDKLSVLPICSIHLLVVTQLPPLRARRQHGTHGQCF